MSAEENKAIVRRWIDASNEHNLELISDLVPPDQIQRHKDQIAWTDATFAGHQATVTDMIAEGDQVWVRLATSGGHSGEYQGIAPTGKQWTNTGVVFVRLSEGKIVQWDILFDELNHVLQLGAIITPPA